MKAAAVPLKRSRRKLSPDGPRRISFLQLTDTNDALTGVSNEEAEMKLRTKVAATLAALVLVVVPATVVANPPAGNGNGPEYNPASEKPKTPGAGAGMPEKARAYGVYCQGQSKKHVYGEKGTPFSQCVNAMAKAANNEKVTPGKACKGMSKKHVKGQKGTAFSRCVNGVAKMRKAHQQD
jgi:hypothetical protein